MASLKPRKRGESSFKELDAEMQRNFSRKMGHLKRLKRDVHEEDVDSGVVFISHIPHGFYEPQMKKFFSQFGNIKRLRLSRSKKSGRSKGYAYIEFEFSEVAKVVAETMHNYLMYQKLLKCWYIPKEKLHPETFKGCFRQFKKPRRREIAAARNNSLLEKGEEHILKRQRRRVNNLQKKQEQLKNLGIDFKIEGLESELKRLKESSSKLAVDKEVEKSTPKAKTSGKTPNIKKGSNTPKRTQTEEDNASEEDIVEPVTKSPKKNQKGKTFAAVKSSAQESVDVDDCLGKSAKKLAKAKKVEKKKVTTPTQKVVSEKTSILKGKGAAKSAKVASKTKSRKDDSGAGMKSKRLSL